MSIMRRAELVLRERRAQVEQLAINRALLKRRGPIERIATALVMTQMPKLPDEQTGGGPRQRGRLDAPPGGGRNK